MSYRSLNNCKGKPKKEFFKILNLSLTIFYGRRQFKNEKSNDRNMQKSINKLLEDLAQGLIQCRSFQISSNYYPFLIH